MTQAASPGLGFAFAIQIAKGSEVTDHTDFSKLRVVNGMVGQQQAIAQFPQEVGMGYHAPGQYKAYNAGVANATWQTRLNGDIGRLLYAFFGSITAADSTAEGTGTKYTTTFRPIADYCDHPWVTARSYLPDCESGVFGQKIWDGKVNALNFQIQAGQPVMTQIGMLAISGSTASDASDWPTGMTATPESTDSVAIASVTGSGLTLGALTGTDLGGGAATAFAMPSIQMQLQMVNTFSGDGIRPELVIGEAGMDDLALLRQDITFNAVYKWRNPELYKAIYQWRTGGVGATWSPQVLKTNVKIVLRSPRYITGTTTYEELELELHDCSIDCPQGLQLQGGSFVTLQITGRAEIQSTVPSFAYAKLINGTAYTDLGAIYS